MDTVFGLAALEDHQLYALIVNHRAKYTAIRGMDYSGHQPQTLTFLPPDDVRDTWERDYVQMQQSMIYGESLSFSALMERLTVLRNRFRAIPGKSHLL